MYDQFTPNDDGGIAYWWAMVVIGFWLFMSGWCFFASAMNRILNKAELNASANSVRNFGVSFLFALASFILLAWNPVIPVPW